MALALWDKAAEVIKSAYQSNALLSYPTSVETVLEDGLTYHIRTLGNLRQKNTLDVALRSENKSSENKSTANHSNKASTDNPFLSHEPELFVSDIGHSHKCLLNKYNVLDQHLLLVTRQFEAQTSALNQTDFDALYHCLCAAPALAFYNGGKTAGASQQHKHIQLIKTAEPIEQLVAFNPQLSALNDEVPRELESLPFKHAALALPTGLFDQRKSEDEAKDAAIQLKHLYDRLRMTLGLDCFSNSKQSEQLPPYNLLMTHDWMLVVPRSEESYSGVSLNALAFSGSILVKGQAQAQLIKQAELSKALNSVT